MQMRTRVWVCRFTWFRVASRAILEHMKPEHKAYVLSVLPFVGPGVLVAAALGYIQYQQSEKLSALTEELQILRAENASSTAAVQANLDILTNALGDVATKNVTLAEALDSERERVEELRSSVGNVEKNVGRVSGSVETLEKLTKTDPELLQKYSKVYFLNEHYIPADLTLIDEQYDFKNGRQVSVHSDVAPFLDKLLEAAWDDGVELWVLSGYRGFDEQSALKAQYTVTYGAGSANTFSADQGYSEHQLGTTVDFTTEQVGSSLVGFDATEAFTWLQKNAHRYGFILSYPEGNEHYVYEPWHWRFVGTDLATYLNKNSKHFYDLDQRKIDEYIPTLFD